MTDFPPVSPYVAGLGGTCPRCGKGKLFKGYLSLRASCSACGLDFAKADSADGPAVFAMFIVGFLAVAVAFVARYAWHAPIWLTFVLSAGFALAAILALLRPLKATLIALQFANRAEEARLEE